MDLKKVKSIHFTGIKGVGMAALAICAKDLKIKVTGSDTDEVFPTNQALKQRKINWKIGFSEKNLPKTCHLVIYTGAHGGSTNPEVIAAQAKNIPILNYGQALALFTQGKKVIATAGVGGKSTTASMLAAILDSAGLNPSFAVGVGNITNLNTPARFSKKSDLFIVETDEYVADPHTDKTPKFHYLAPHIAIITNIEHDHPDVYPSIRSIYKSFKIFVDKMPKNGFLIVNIDNPHIKEFIQSINRKVITYGFSPQADWQIVKTHTAHKKQFFSIKQNNIPWPDFILHAPGKYNVLNATAAIIAAHQLNVSPEKIQAGVKAYTGTKRRFEFINQVKGIELYDDYAHHPIEIQALLKATKDWLPGKRIFAIFQSHTYSRTKTLLNQFAQSFNQAHKVIINDIFASAREKEDLSINGEILTQAIKKYNSQTFFCPGKTATIKFLKENLVKGDVIFTMGAGNNWLWHKDILKAIRGK